MKRLRDEDGQVVVVVAILSVLLIGLLALVLDVGSWYRDQRHVRSVADAAALAGAMDMPNQSAAQASATAYWSSNGGANNQGTISTSFPDQLTIKVVAADKAPTYLAKIFGFTSISVSQSASARVLAASTASGARPFVVSAYNSALSGSACGHSGVPCFNQSVQLDLGSGESEEGEESDGFGLACLDSSCPSGGGEESSGVNCLTSTWTGWVQNGYGPALTLPASFPRCSTNSGSSLSCNGNHTASQKQVWNFSTAPCNNRAAVSSLVHSGGCSTAQEIYMLVTGRGEGEGSGDSVRSLASASEEENHGQYKAVGWARFCITAANFGGTGEEAQNWMRGYFDAYNPDGNQVPCTPITSCYYGVGTIVLSN